MTPLPHISRALRERGIRSNARLLFWFIYKLAKASPDGRTVIPFWWFVANGWDYDRETGRWEVEQIAPMTSGVMARQALCELEAAGAIRIERGTHPTFPATYSIGLEEVAE